jgi:hypothetical protein
VLPVEFLVQSVLFVCGWLHWEHMLDPEFFEWFAQLAIVAASTSTCAYLPAVCHRLACTLKARRL